RISELIPEIKDVVVATEPGDISGPVRSAAGFHLLKRGERIESQILPLDKVAPQVRAALRQSA
ncbi:MAG: peptidylprolyl isomerase, partial [Pseudomonas stutzeri]|nr:peptidylprolyl isomerase [Stutzerimonas stutzeri]NIP75636.1 peptidylprolyl isomerase [Xanthomonadales bacterium]NIQ44626.1 peptidylprolyl isomerase [Stutzerimonas stutzeri]NIS59094.1 peptidylprolyl isomerase [Stutzerimonas stutzeri]